MDEVELPQCLSLLKKTSSMQSGSFISGLRRDLHPVVINQQTKKRKRDAMDCLIQENLTNNKRFKFNVNDIKKIIKK